MYDVTVPSWAVIDEMADKLASMGVANPGLSLCDSGHSLSLKVSTRPTPEARRAGSVVVGPIAKTKRQIGEKKVGEEVRPIYALDSIIRDEHLQEAASKLPKPKGKSEPKT